MSTLPKRLREWANYETIPNGDRPRSDMREAAKRIEVLEAALEEIRARATPHPDDVDKDRMRDLFHIRSIARRALQGEQQ